MGVIILLLLVAVAIGIFSYCGFKNAPFTYLSKEFETEYGVVGMVKERDEKFSPFGVATNIIATCLCILSPIPILIAAFFGNGFSVCVCVTVTLAIVGIAVMLYIIGTVRSLSMHRLMRDGVFSEEAKKKGDAGKNVASTYWLAATAIYVAWSLLSGRWTFTWVLWPVAGILFPLVYIIYTSISNKKEK